MKKENGILTLEATISLTAFMMFILFFLNFAKVYQAQNIVAYGAYETARKISLETYTAEAIASSDIGALISEVLELKLGTTELDGGDIFLLTNGSIQERAKSSFVTAVSAESESLANKYLQDAGIRNGISGLDFTGTALHSNDILIVISYKVDLVFPFMGIDSIGMEQRAQSRLWKFTEWSD